jgi:hypothetical protein
MAVLGDVRPENGSAGDRQLSIKAAVSLRAQKSPARRHFQTSRSGNGD